jgi:hypothetical protein
MSLSQVLTLCAVSYSQINALESKIAMSSLLHDINVVLSVYNEQYIIKSCIF